MAAPTTVLAINCGSSTVKYAVYHHRKGEDFEELCTGLVDRIGLAGSSITHTTHAKGKARVIRRKIAIHGEGIANLLKLITSEEALDSLDEIDAIGHRVVHGGPRFVASTLLDKASMKAIKETIPIAPLHNPHNLAGILACASLGRPQVAVFDTTFHATMPESSWRYAIPREWSEKYSIRRYGFHGISHQYVAKEAARTLRRPLSSLKLITCHLGNGSSLTAIDGGKSVENTMGYTPLEGVIMGTRSGSLDPAIPLLLMEKTRLSAHGMEERLNRKSGLFAIAGTRDMRELLLRAGKGDADSQLAVEMYCSSVAKAIGGYLALLDGADAIVFTAGIGENDPEIRRRILAYFHHAGIHLCGEWNDTNRRVITRSSSRIAALVIPTREELEIAREVRRVLARRRQPRAAKSL